MVIEPVLIELDGGDMVRLHCLCLHEASGDTSLCIECITAGVSDTHVYWQERAHPWHVLESEMLQETLFNFLSDVVMVSVLIELD